MPRNISVSTTLKRDLLIHPFEPLWNEHSQVLILGSFPSVVSRARNFYYANPGNRFWRVMAAVFEADITDRRQFCLDHGIALWDVIGSCRIQGSADASISDVTVNDIAAFTAGTKIRVVFTTGTKASRLYAQNVQCDLPHIALPSTSGANARMRTEDLIKAYRIIRTYAEKD